MLAPHRVWSGLWKAPEWAHGVAGVEAELLPGGSQQAVPPALRGKEPISVSLTTAGGAVSAHWEAKGLAPGLDPKGGDSRAT